MRIVLASTSAARRDLMTAAKIPFEAVAPGVDESIDGDPRTVAVRLALAKAKAVAAREPDALVIGADQVLSFQGKGYGKPTDREAARRLLATLAGEAHELNTGVAVLARARSSVALDVARLEMRALTPEEIDRYVATDEWQGCAGGYRIEGAGIHLFGRIEGDYTGIQGLPMLLLGRMLRDAGVPLP